MALHFGPVKVLRWCETTHVLIVTWLRCVGGGALGNGRLRNSVNGPKAGSSKAV